MPVTHAARPDLYQAGLSWLILAPEESIKDQYRQRLDVLLHVFRGSGHNVKSGRFGHCHKDLFVKLYAHTIAYAGINALFSALSGQNEVIFSLGYLGQATLSRRNSRSA